ncbi:citramalate synthase [Eubacteriales bacterium OttesenSCG-928-N13]|nr:citramalate synthase [Eubacteriales bacterium OttesenSCG-928-N13]
MKIQVLDTTLRDGAQGEGVVFSHEDKIQVIRALDALGVDYIEAGNPASNPKDQVFFAYATEKLQLMHAKLVAFGSTCHAGCAAQDDPGLRALIQSGAQTISLFGKSSLLHVEQVLQTTPEENLRLITDSVKLLVDHGLQVFYDAEHFFDGYNDDPDYALRTLRAAQEAGAQLIVLCDTNGGTLPGDINRITQKVKKAISLPLAIHCHNDAGLATACTLAGIEAGAIMVQGTINGYGERCGNADLCQVIPNLELKMGHQCLPDGKLPSLSKCARLIAEIANLSMYEHSPYVGRSAFAHKGGMHIDGMLKDRRSFEHIDPELVGNSRRYLVSEVAGRGALMTRLAQIAPDLSKESEQTLQIMDMLKQLEQRGYSFEGAEGSLALRVLGSLDRRRNFFEVLDFHVVSRKPENDKNAQAFVKVMVDGQQEITADEGDGPVNALDLAIRKALTRFYPCIGRMRLRDFTVRVVDSEGSASSVRVRVESTDGEHDWATVGVSSNVIEASFIALTDSIEYMLMRELDGWQ